MHQLRVVHLHAEAPLKPRPGAACNGCGLCCAAEPCPLGMLRSLRVRGRCSALRWNARSLRYDCGLLAAAARLGSWPGRLLARWIAAGEGCDAQLEPAPAPGSDAR